MNKQQAYDFFLASLSMEIIATGNTLEELEPSSENYLALQERAARLQRMLAGLDEIYHAVPEADS
ncbi:hypothetical protein AWB80_06208 [Caballeronia pedi]|uniref:Uncharacterized protein n=1 Tax=Caballeronia pedi TaxID=1777141 RepID=A0A158D2V2_9BURK|nr:hypothetical protein [Caballeronia pedi]SAK88918.1 hypothetical protein AWB80_06208 [Caballeronia pedi]